MNEDVGKAKLHARVVVEDWYGPDADERRESGEPPDAIYEYEDDDLEEDPNAAKSY